MNGWDALTACVVIIAIMIMVLVLFFFCSNDLVDVIKAWRKEE